MPADARTNILFLGGTTHANRGDLAMHQGRLNWVAEHLPELRSLFLANNPETTQEVLGVPSELSPDASLAQPWNKQTPGSTLQRLQSLVRGTRFAYRPGPFARQLQQARAVIIPGSGSMNSLWWHDWLYVKAAEVRCARHTGVPVFMTSQGVGPAFTHWLDRWVARRMFQACHLVGVRDAEQSGALLRSIGVSGEKIVHTGDDALLVEPDHGTASGVLESIPKGRILLGLNVRDSHTYGRGYAKPLPKVWAAALDQLIDEGLDAHVLFVPISYDAQDDDRIAARKVIENMRHQDRATLPEAPLHAAALRALCAALHVGAGTSYHFLLFCLSAGVPALGLWQNPYYEHKQSGLFGLYEQPEYAVNLGALGPEGLHQKLRAMVQEQAATAAALASRNTALQSSAAQSNQRILDLLRPAATSPS